MKSTEKNVWLRNIDKTKSLIEIYFLLISYDVRIVKKRILNDGFGMVPTTLFDWKLRISNGNAIISTDMSMWLKIISTKVIYIWILQIWFLCYSWYIEYSQPSTSKCNCPIIIWNWVAFGLYDYIEMFHQRKWLNWKWWTNFQIEW